MPCHDTAFLGSKTQFRRHSNAKVEASAEFFSTLLMIDFWSSCRQEELMNGLVAEDGGNPPTRSWDWIAPCMMAICVT